MTRNYSRKMISMLVLALVIAVSLALTTQVSMAKSDEETAQKVNMYETVKVGNIVYCIGCGDVGDTNFYKVNLTNNKKTKIISKIWIDDGGICIAEDNLFFGRRGVVYRLNLLTEELTPVWDFETYLHAYSDDIDGIYADVAADKLYVNVDCEENAGTYEMSLDGSNLKLSALSIEGKFKTTNKKGYKVIDKWKKGKKKGKKGWYGCSYLKTPTKKILLHKKWSKWPEL